MGHPGTFLGLVLPVPYSKGRAYPTVRKENGSIWSNHVLGVQIGEQGVQL